MTTRPNQFDVDKNFIKIKSLADRAIQVFEQSELTVAKFVADDARRELEIYDAIVARGIISRQALRPSLVNEVVKTQSALLAVKVRQNL
ncbi:MAG: hypothetical protein WAV41_00285 [Microgenomates group bacterium]